MAAALTLSRRENTSFEEENDHENGGETQMSHTSTDTTPVASPGAIVASDQRIEIGSVIGFIVTFEHGSQTEPISGNMTAHRSIVEISRKGRQHFYDLSKATRWSYEIETTS